MTVTLTDVSTVVYTGNGVTTAFETTFPFVNAADLTVTEIVVADETEEVLTLGVDYSVTGGEYDTGTVTALLGAPSSFVQWRIDRDTPVDQPTDFQPTGEFPIATLERQMDRIVLVQQEQRRDMDEILGETFATQDYVDDAVEGVEDSAEQAALDANAAAVSAAAAAASLAAILDGGLASSPVSAAMEPVLAAASLAAARTAMGVPQLASNQTWTGNNTWSGGTATFSAGLTAAGTTAVAILTASGAATITGLVTANAGVLVAGGAVNTAAEVDVASATTTNLSTAASNKVRITGTTTITGITLADGRFRFVRFADALILTHGASLILPSGANITTVAGDTALIAGEASDVVRVLDYQRASGAALVTSTGKVAQVVTATWNTQTTFTNTTPFDNTIPQNTEGAERFTCAITPVNAASVLHIEVVLHCYISVQPLGAAADVGHIIAHLHRDSTASALATAHISAYADAAFVKQDQQLVLRHSVSAGATDETTFKVRSGTVVAAAGATIVVAHNGAAAAFGGTRASRITVTEILP